MKKNVPCLNIQHLPGSFWDALAEAAVTVDMSRVPIGVAAVSVDVVAASIEKVDVSILKTDRFSYTFSYHIPLVLSLRAC